MINSFIAFLSLPLSMASGTNDAKLLQGVWVPVKWQLAGSATPPPTMASMKLTLKNDKYEFIEGPAHDIGRFVIRAKQNPKEMDIIGVKGPNAGKTYPAIYRVQGDKATICYGLDGHRPKTFASPKKSLILLITFSRAKS